MFKRDEKFMLFQQSAFIAHKVLNLEIVQEYFDGNDVLACCVPKSFAMAYARRLTRFGFTVVIQQYSVK